MATSAEEASRQRELLTGWEASRDGHEWLPARVPGTAAGVLRDAGLWREGEPSDLDAQDWWFRTRFDAPPAAAGEEVVLALDGLATLAEVRLNGEPLLSSDSMFLPRRADVGHRLRGDNELLIHFRPLAPLLTEARRPRARWRTRVADGNLRFFRTALLGRAPGFAPGPAPVGPWRPVRVERRRGIAIDELRLRPRIDGDDGVLAMRACVRALDGEPVEGAELEVDGPSGVHTAALAIAGGRLEGEVVVPSAERWWPHTHGTPALHAVRLRVRRPDGVVEVGAGRTGFRTLAPGAAASHDVESDGLQPHVNGVRVFARGAVWTPGDPVALTTPEPVLRAALERVRDAGMNMVRVPGVGVYEDDAFHDLCDELGILVWQDLMFANFDYPAADPAFADLVEAEVRAVAARLAGRPSTAVLCGGSEVEQQAAMFGADPALARGELFGERIPALARELLPDAAWVPSAPCGGALPFRPGRGIANYYGVGAYGLPLEDARRAGVRFAAECLAFANMPDDDAEADAWIPRDGGADWDFADVRDRYLGLLYGVDPGALRHTDPARYRALSRAVSGEVMAEVMGEWRRAASPCGGGLVLWLRDLAPGSGWGVLDHRGLPKAAYHHLRRVLAPVAVWTTDEQLNGIAVHVANDRPEPLRARLRVALYADGERRVEEAAEDLVLPGGGNAERDVEAMLGHFVDASWAYRFGPPAQDVIVAGLHDADGRLLSQALRFPAGRPRGTEPAERLGLTATLRPRDDGDADLEVAARRVVHGLRVHAPGFAPDDDAFGVEPGGSRTVRLRRTGAAGGPPPGVSLTALNLDGRVDAR